MGNARPGFWAMNTLVIFIMIVAAFAVLGFGVIFLAGYAVAGMEAIRAFLPVILLIIGLIAAGLFADRIINPNSGKKKRVPPAPEQPAPDPIKKAENDLDTWTLIVRLKGENSADRIDAIRGLRSHTSPAVDEELMKAMLEDGDMDIRYEACLALKYHGKDATGRLLDELKASGDTGSKLGLLELLRRTGDLRQIQMLIYLYDFETDKSVRLSIIESLSKFNSEKIRDLAISVLRREDDKDVRLKALGALHWYDDAYTQEALKGLLDDTDNDIKSMASRSLQAIELRTS